MREVIVIMVMITIDVMSVLVRARSSRKGVSLRPEVLLERQVRRHMKEGVQGIREQNEQQRQSSQLPRLEILVGPGQWIHLNRRGYQIPRN